MKKRSISITLVLFILGLTTSAFCADVAKIGVFSLQKILIESSAGKLTKKEINDHAAQLKNKLGQEKKQLEEMRKSFEKEALVLSPEKKKEKERELRIKINDFKKMQEDFAEELRKLERKLINRIQREIHEISNEIGEEEGFLLILEKKKAGVVYHPAKVDITDQVIKKYNLKVSKFN